MTTEGPLPPGSTIGVLGGGQLGRMLALAAARLGLRVHIFCPEADSPAAEVAATATCAAYDDEAALTAFAGAVDVITYEFENIPAQSVALLEKANRLYPPARALEITQDRFTEKSFIQSHGLGTAAFREVSSFEQLKAAVADIGIPSVLKTRRFGYDGKGQALIRSLDDIEDAWKKIAEAPAILEAFVDFTCETSVIVARDQSGRIACYDPPLNHHDNHILAQSIVPSGLPAAVEDKARDVAAHLAEDLGYVGVMGVELFVTKDNDVLVNEIAPRVHNTGHWTIDACVCSQFEQHIRAICGWPLGSAERHSNASMTNLIGAGVDAWPYLADEPGIAIHLYGKKESRPGRKMGHATRITPRTDS